MCLTLILFELTQCKERDTKTKPTKTRKPSANSKQEKYLIVDKKEFDEGDEMLGEL